MSEKDRKRQMHDIASTQGWDQKPASLAHEIAQFLESIKDEGTKIDTGMGDGIGDIWITVGGVEYFISIEKSAAQKQRDGTDAEKRG